MTKKSDEKAPAPRELTTAELREAAGGRGLLITCIEHNGHSICRLG